MEMLRIMGMTIFLLFCWLVFLIGPIHLCVISACRSAAWWHPQDKNPSYIEIKSDFLARLLVPRYCGDSSYLRTNIPVFYDQFVWNDYPNRLSRIGAICYGAAIIPTAFYALQISSYFLAGNFDNDLVPVSLGLLVISGIGISVAARLNQGKREPPQLLTREEIKRRTKRGKEQKDFLSGKTLIAVMCGNILFSLIHKIWIISMGQIGLPVILPIIFWAFILKGKRWARIAFYILGGFCAALGLLGVALAVAYIYRGRDPLPCIMAVINGVSYAASIRAIRKSVG